MTVKHLNIYFAGKLSSHPGFGNPDWRMGLAGQLAGTLGIFINNLDPAGESPQLALDENDQQFIFGRECFMIRQADLVVVLLTDDISVGGSQEMLIAKYFRKPLLGLIPQGSKKFNGTRTFNGRTYENWMHPFVGMTCDKVAKDVPELAGYIKSKFWLRKDGIKDITIVDKAIEYYYRSFYRRDTVIHGTAEYSKDFIAYKGLILDPHRRNLLVVRYADHPNVAADIRGRYGLPGGRIPIDGNAELCFTQRVEEETGIRIKPRHPFYSWKWHYKRNKISNQITAIAYVAHYREGRITQPARKDETDLERAEWLPLDKLSVTSFTKSVRPVIKNFLKHLELKNKAV